MKITESQLRTIILEEAAKVKKAISLKKQLKEVQQQLDEVMGGPHGGGKKKFKGEKGDFVPKEFPGALVEKENTEEEEVVSEIGMPGENSGCDTSGAPTAPGAAPMENMGHSTSPEEETFDFSEEELEEMLNMATQEEVMAPQINEEEAEEEIVAEADKISQPFTVDAKKGENERSPKSGTLQEEAEEEEEVVAEADKTSQPFTVDAKKGENERSPKSGTLQESAEVLRMKKLAGIIK